MAGRLAGVGHRARQRRAAMPPSSPSTPPDRPRRAPQHGRGALRRPAEGTDEETVADEVEGYVSGLLGMVGSSPTCWSAAHILLANLIHHARAGGADLDLATLVAQVQEPSLRKLGVYETDTFFPPADRTKLAMTSTACWRRARSPRGRGPRPRPRRPAACTGRVAFGCSIVSLAHLDDGERQFVSLLLGKPVTRTRRQPGTDKLRVFVYIDEVSGVRAAHRGAAGQEADPDAVQNRPGRSAWAWCSPPRTRWTSTTRPGPTPAPG